MNNTPVKDIVSKRRIDYLGTQLSDVGGYCYISLTSVALNMLYREEDKDNNWNKEFVEQTVKCLSAHLSQPEKVTETALLIATSVDIQHYQPFIDSLQKEPVVISEGLNIFPKDLVVVGLQQGCYDARLRTLAKFVSLMLKVDWSEIELHEDFVLRTFQEEEHVETEEEKKEKTSKDKIRKIKKVALIGAAAVGGGVLVGLTGGLAAPFIAAGAGAVIGGAGAAALGSTAGIAIIGSLFGVAGAGLGGFKMKKRVGDVEEFTFEPLTEGSQLHVTIAITGWITEECPDFAFAWRGLANSEEQFVLRYESKYLKQMGSAMDYLLSFAVSQATSEALKYTVLSSIMAAIVWPATILAASSVIDNPWSMMTSRTVQAGKMLADVLLSRQQGKRPVTLIGFSLGARVIFYCLQEMAKRKNSEGIIEDAVMLGTPATASPADWKVFSRVVAGKVVNGYCRGDWLLKFLYRTASVQFSIAGLEPIKWTDRRMHNIDLSQIVEGHMDYMKKLDQILDIVGIKTKPRATGGSKHNLKEWVAVNKVKTGISPSTSSSNELKAQAEPEIAQDAGAAASAEVACSNDNPVRLEDVVLRVDDQVPDSSNNNNNFGNRSSTFEKDCSQMDDKGNYIEAFKTGNNGMDGESNGSPQRPNEEKKQCGNEGVQGVAHDLVNDALEEVKTIIQPDGKRTKDREEDNLSHSIKETVKGKDVLGEGSCEKSGLNQCNTSSNIEETVGGKDFLGDELCEKVSQIQCHTPSNMVTDICSGNTKESTKESGLLEVSSASRIIASFPSSDSGFDSFATQEDIGSPEKGGD